MAHHLVPRPVLSRRAALSLLAGGLLLASGCAAPKIESQRYPDYDLESAKTYAWITDELVLIQFGQDQPKVRTKDNEQLIRAAVDRELAKRGLVVGPRESADLLVAFSVGLRTRYRLEGGPGTAVTMDGPGETQLEGTLNIYLLDRANEREVWHGWASKRLEPTDEPQPVIDEAVAGIMALYPNSSP